MANRNIPGKPLKDSEKAAQELGDLLLGLNYGAEHLDRVFRQVHDHVMAGSEHLNNEGNFTRIGTYDLIRMFDYYDATLLCGRVRETVKAQGSTLSFDLSRRLTRSGGHTKRTRPSTARPFDPAKYEIAVSVPVLFATFHDIDRPIKACGRLCFTRFEALQRIMEHEILHLAEMLSWDVSNCSARRYKSLAINTFGHTESHHQLITPAERAIKNFGVKPGAKVYFEFDGRRIVGVVNSIRRRATVLVPSPSGTLYSDGYRYEKYYVSVEQLKPV
ncbi:MAG: hypothetical protein ACKO0V_09595 [bacterium]